MMPNGGSDCCGTCWFNAKNKGEAGYAHSHDAAPASCTIRNLAIEVPFYTYCANHPHRRPHRDPTPIGPVFVQNTTGDRMIWKTSPDTPQIRDHLLTLLRDIKAKPASEYPIGMYADEVVVWQLGEFLELRAVAELQRIQSINPETTEDGPYHRTRHVLVTLARQALAKITTGT